MALTATIYNLSVELADIDRGVYEKLDVCIARQPSETIEYMFMRVIAYCLEYGDKRRWTVGWYVLLFLKGGESCVPAERLSMECALSRYVAGRQSATDSSIMRVLTGHITTTKTEATSGASRRSAKVAGSRIRQGGWSDILNIYGSLKNPTNGTREK